jgi:hypothetical protein
MILYLKDPKDSTRRVLDLVYTSSKVAGYKKTTHKKMIFCMHQQQFDEKETGKQFHSQSSPKYMIPRNKTQQRLERPLQ